MKPSLAKILFGLPLFMIVALPDARSAAPAGLDYSERVALQQDGSADIEITVSSPDTATVSLQLPWGYAAPDRLALSDSTQHGEVIEKNGVRFLIVTGSSAPVRECSIRAHVSRLVDWTTIKRSDFGNMTLSHQFRNTTTSVFATFHADYILPAGLTVTSIVSSIPEQTEKEPVAPFEVIRKDGRTGLTLKSGRLRTGDVAAVSFRCKPVDKSPLLFGGLVVIAALYLIFFRDVLKENSNGPAAPQNAQA
jgi:hypothetical protein